MLSKGSSTKTILQPLKTFWNSSVQLTKYKLAEGGVERKQIYTVS